jgi:hypothetical protein
MTFAMPMQGPRHPLTVRCIRFRIQSTFHSCLNRAADGRFATFDIAAAPFADVNPTTKAGKFSLKTICARLIFPMGKDAVKKI